MPLNIIRNDKTSAPSIDKIANKDSVISKIAIRASRKSLDVKAKIMLQTPFKNTAKNIGKKYILK